MTQDQLAEKMHVTRQAVSNWETDKAIGDPNMVREGPKPSKRLFPRRVKS